MSPVVCLGGVRHRPATESVVNVGTVARVLDQVRREFVVARQSGHR